VKLHIYTTNNHFLEEPIKVSFCGKIESDKTNDCKCDMGIFRRFSSPIAEIDFGKRFFDCNARCNVLPNSALKATITKTPNKTLVCGCGNCK